MNNYASYDEKIEEPQNQSPNWEIKGDKVGTLIEAENTEMIYNVVTKYQKVIIDYSASWCGPCKMLKPFLSELAKSNPEVVFLVVDIDNEDCIDIVQKCNIKSLPTVQFYFNQKMLGDVIGFRREQISKYLNNMINYDPSIEENNK